MSEDSDEYTAYYWGELPPKYGITEQFAELMARSVMKPVAVKLREPCEGEEPTVIELPPECSAMEPTVVHTIKLIQYAKSMQSVIDKLKSKKSNVMPPDFPEQPSKKLKHPVRPYCFMERISTPFTEGIGTPPHRLTEKNARSILKKSVAAISAHIGFDDATQVALDVMTDISEHYFLKFTRVLRMAVDQEMLSGNTGFPDVMERAFHEMGIGSILVLHNFYHERILMYHERTLNQCRKLASDYVELTKPTEVQEIIECKMETEEDYSNVPELHVPASGDGTSPDQLCPPFVQGFKMLQKIEQEEQLQNRIKQEEITIGGSPK